MGTLKKDLEQALQEFYESYNENYTSPEAVASLQKTFQSHNITIEDWNTLLDYLTSNNAFDKSAADFITKLVNYLDEVHFGGLFQLSNKYIKQVDANTIVRPYLDGNGEYQEMVNNVFDSDKNSKYQKRMNFDGEADTAYIDTHLSSKGSIYTAVTGENAAININVLGDDSLLFAQLDGYSNIRLMSKGDNDKKALNYILLGTDTNDEVLKGAPLLFLKNDGENAPKYGLAFDCQTNKLGYVTKDNSGNITFTENNDYVPRLNTSGLKIYAHSGSSQFELDYNILTTANSIAQRDSNANIKVGLALNPDEALNLTRAYDFLVKKLSTGGNFVYAHDSTVQKEIIYSALPIANTIVYRAFDGNFCSGTPTANEHVVNKGYVDNLVTPINNWVNSIAKNKADLVDGLVPASQLPSYVDDVVEFKAKYSGSTWYASCAGTSISIGELCFNDATASYVPEGTSGPFYKSFTKKIKEPEATWLANPETYKTQIIACLEAVAPETGKIYVGTTDTNTYRWTGSNLVEISKSLSTNSARNSGTSGQAYRADYGKANYEDIVALQQQIATADTLGRIKVGSDTTQTVAANSVTSTASRTYAIQKNSSNQLVVNVPWTDTNTTYSFTTNNPTLAWGQTSIIGTAGGVTYKVTMPENPNTDTHYTAYNYVGAANSASNAATSNGSTCLKLYENGTQRSQFYISGSGGTLVSSDSSGNIKIYSTDNPGYSFDFSSARSQYDGQYDISGTWRITLYFADGTYSDFSVNANGGTLSKTNVVAAQIVANLSSSTGYYGLLTNTSSGYVFSTSGIKSAYAATPKFPGDSSSEFMLMSPFKIALVYEYNVS